MNDCEVSSMKTPPSPATECPSKLHHFARENPTRTVLIAVGCGFALGILLRTLRPRPPENRTARMLTALRNRLHGTAEPVRRQADHLVESGTSAVRSGVAHFQNLHIKRSACRRTG